MQKLLLFKMQLMSHNEENVENYNEIGKAEFICLRQRYFLLFYNEPHTINPFKSAISGFIN